jgi:hypothetical protein
LISQSRGLGDVYKRQRLDLVELGVVITSSDNSQWAAVFKISLQKGIGLTHLNLCARLLATPAICS